MFGRISCLRARRQDGRRGYGHRVVATKILKITIHSFIQASKYHDKQMKNTDLLYPIAFIPSLLFCQKYLTHLEY